MPKILIFRCSNKEVQNWTRKMKTKNKKQKQLSLVPNENLVVSHHTYHCKSTRSSFIGPKYREKNTTESFCRSLSLSLSAHMAGLIESRNHVEPIVGAHETKQMWGQCIYKSGPTFGLGPLPSPDRIRRLVWEWEIIKPPISKWISLSNQFGNVNFLVFCKVWAHFHAKLTRPQIPRSLAIEALMMDSYYVMHTESS